MESVALPWPVVLGSASPRRREILGRIVPEFIVDTPDLDEDAYSSPIPWQTALDLARAKADVVAERHPDKVVIAGDTVVAIPIPGGYTQLAKPVDRADAIRMLSLLAGIEHLVITGVCIRWPEGVKSFEVTTGVTFTTLTPAEIEQYVDAGESMDKAGAYAAQGRGAAIIERVRGSMSNVIGLPEAEVRAALRELTVVPTV